MNVLAKLESAGSVGVDKTQAPSGLASLVIVALHHGMHLSVSQLIHDNILTNQEVSLDDIVKCSKSVGLTAKVVDLDWDGLGQLRKTLPAIVRLRNGASMVLLQAESKGDVTGFVKLQDPNADDGAPLVLDRIRFEDVWTGEVILVKRDYEIDDEEQPFGLGLVAALLFRERWMVRDVAICAFMMSFLALAPIMFWRIMSDKVLYFKAYNTFFVLCIAMLVLIVFEALFTYLRQFLILSMTRKVDAKLGTYLFEKVLNLPIDFFERTQSGKIFHDMWEIRKIRSFMVGQLFGTILDSTTLLIFIPIMFFFSPAMTAVVLGCCGLIILWVLVMMPVIRRKTSEATKASTEYASFLVQTIHGIRTVKSLALDARQRHLSDVHVARVANLQFAAENTANLLYAGVRPLERLALTASFALGVYLSLSSSDAVYVGALFAFMLLSQRVSAPLTSMARLVNQLDEARVAVAVVSKLVNQPAEEGRSGHGVLTPLRGKVEFSGVTFKYTGAPTPALDDVKFEIPEGGTLGIMGRSGSGKTTITRLLQRLHSNYEGLIKIDGVDVREYDVDHLRHSLGVVLQENFLFSGTIRENIAAAKSDATFDDVVRAARLAGAEEFIDKLPRAYETHIYEGSPNLSGGQRQRLAIARALITDPRILILDEATSALDADSEAIVNANINRIGYGRTLIIISHRLTSLVDADAILVLERGKVQDIGKHQELLSRCDIYSDMWHQQTRSVLATVNRREKPSLRRPNLVS
jgi:ATP-binding cassette, subfamily B, bacterial HlyB/CyaB